MKCLKYVGVVASLLVLIVLMSFEKEGFDNDINNESNLLNEMMSY